MKDSISDTLTSAFKFLSYSPRSVHEMRLHLESKSYDAEEVCSALLLLIRDNYLNDDNFASMLVGSRTEQKHWGKHKIAIDLKRRGIPQTVIDGSLTSIDHRAEERTAKKALEKWTRARKVTRPLDEKTAQRAYRHLEARGFSASLIIPLLKQMGISEAADNGLYEPGL